MENIKFFLNLTDIDRNIYILKICYISICTSHTIIKLLNDKINLYKKILFVFNSIIIAIICGTLKYVSNTFYSILFFILLLTINYSYFVKKSITESILNNVIALGINYIIFFIAVILSFIPNVVFNIRNDYISLISIILIYTFILNIFLNMKKIKYGFSFLQNKIANENIDSLILNLSIMIIFATTILTKVNVQLQRNLLIFFLIFSIIMFITIQKSLQLYYKQRLLEQELKETKEELENKKKEIEKLEAENLNFSKTSHTLAHKQKSLEYKLEQLKQKYEIAEEIEIKDRIKNLSKELYGKTIEIELSKTGITEIDDMLKYMQSECIKNKIEFQLQIKGNIYEMVNNYISKEDLTTLIADHVKNAIIAINYSDNINKSILVRLGKIDKIYSLYIYDSGIEFEKETLLNLGKKPSTTHADNGGTGMGFMNTFDTLKKYNASLIINEYNKPDRDNYTKSIMIKFDKKNEFKINSYR